MDYVFISDYWFSVLSIISTKGDFIVFFGYSCQGSTGLSTSKHEAVGLYGCFLIFTEYISNHYSPVFAGTYFHFLILQICEFIGRHYEACKIGKIFRKYLTAIAVNILITLIVCTYFFKLTRKRKD